jgi:hypothetical protein
MWWWWNPYFAWAALMMAEPLPEGYVAHLPPPQSRAPLRHPFGAAVTIPKEKSASGFEQKEKTCSHCGCVRVTVWGHGVAWREWRRNADGPQIKTSIAPPCDPEAGWGR